MSWFADKMTRCFFISSLAALCVGGCVDSKPTRSTPLQRAVEAVGGPEALTSLESLRIEAAGRVATDYESPHPSEPEDVSTYVTTYTFDFGSDRLRVDTVRTPLFEALRFFPPMEYSIVLDGDVGGLSAQAGFAPPGSVPSQYVGALWVQQRLFNPHFYLRDGLVDQGLIGDGGETEIDGRRHRVIRFAGPRGEVRLFVDDETGFISQLETVSNHVLVRDISISIRYRDWQFHGPLAFPSTVELLANGELLQEETRSAVTTDPVFPADTFEFPPEAADATVDTEAYAFGEQTHQVMDAFFHLGFFIEEAPEIVTSEVAPGLTLLRSGGAANSLAVRTEQGLVLFEAPASPRHGSNLLAALGEAFPGVAVTHAVQSHYHQDHASGLRSFAAAGATAVVGHGVGDFWKDVFRADSTLRPDALAAADVSVVVEEVPLDGTLVVGGTDSGITIHHLSANPHADDMVFGVIESGGEIFVYQADLYNAGFGLTLVLGGPEALFAGLRDRGIIDSKCQSAVPLTIIPAHGNPMSLADSLSELAEQNIDIGCS